MSSARLREAAAFPASDPSPKNQTSEAEGRGEEEVRVDQSSADRDWGEAGEEEAAGRGFDTEWEAGLFEEGLFEAGLFEEVPFELIVGLALEVT